MRYRRGTLFLEENGVHTVPQKHTKLYFSPETLGLRFGKLHRLCLVSFYFKVIQFHVARSELLLFCYGELACNGMM